MKCFLVGYRGTCHLSLVFSSYTNSPKGECITTLVFISCLKNTANQRPGLPLQFLQYATGSMQLLLRTSQKPALKLSTPANHYQHFRSRPEIFRCFSNTSEDFRRFFENFKKSEKHF